MERALPAHESKTLNLLYLHKNQEHHCFVFDAESLKMLEDHLRSLPAETKSVTWFDVMVLINKARWLCRQKMDSSSD